MTTHSTECAPDNLKGVGAVAIVAGPIRLLVLQLVGHGSTGKSPMIASVHVTESWLFARKISLVKWNLEDHRVWI